MKKKTLSPLLQHSLNVLLQSLPGGVGAAFQVLEKMSQHERLEFLESRLFAHSHQIANVDMAIADLRSSLASIEEFLETLSTTSVQISETEVPPLLFRCPSPYHRSRAMERTQQFEITQYFNGNEGPVLTGGSVMRPLLRKMPGPSETGGIPFRFTNETTVERQLTASWFSLVFEFEYGWSIPNKECASKFYWTCGANHSVYTGPLKGVSTFGSAGIPEISDRIFKNRSYDNVLQASVDQLSSRILSEYGVRIDSFVVSRISADPYKFSFAQGVFTEG